MREKNYSKIEMKKRLAALLVAFVFMFGTAVIPSQIYAVENDDQAATESIGSEAVTEETAGADETAADANNPEAVAEEEEATPEDATSEHEEDSADDVALSDEEIQVTFARSIEDVAKKSNVADNEAFFTIDVGDNKAADNINVDKVAVDIEEIIADGGSTKAKKNDVVDVLEDSGYYTAVTGSGREVDVTSTFALQRLCLIAEKEDSIVAYGAETAVYYDNSYLLTYESEEATKRAFDALTEEYGSDLVMVDVPVKAASDTTIYGWGTSYMGLTSEKNNSNATQKVKVAVIDTGVNQHHSIFAGKTFENAFNVITGGNNVADDNGHGTAVCGIVSESTPSNVSIMPIKALNSSASGSLQNILFSAKYASDHGADIINLSLGGETSQKILEDCEEFFRNNCGDTLIVGASGNETCNLDAKGVHYFPGEVASTVCVGAYNRSEKICSWSNYGSAIDFAAPGSNICVADYTNNDEYAIVGGTSFASPYVAAAAALEKAKGTTNLRSALEGIAVDMGATGDDNYFGKGCPIFTEEDRIDKGGSVERNGVAIFNVFDEIYTGVAITQKPEIIQDGFELKKGTDYTLSYRNNINAGTATMTVTGVGLYEGSRDVQFTIDRMPIDLAARLSQASYTYDGVIKTPTIISKLGNTVLKEGTDYEAVYSGGRVAPGRYNVTVTGIGNYIGSVNMPFVINRPADIVDLPLVKIKKPSAGKKKLTAKWKKVNKSNQKKIAGIEIEVVGNGIDVIYTAGKSKKTKTIKNLKSKKYYKVRVRAYRFDGYYKHVSKWSTFKKKKIK